MASIYNRLVIQSIYLASFTSGRPQINSCSLRKGGNSVWGRGCGEELFVSLKTFFSVCKAAWKALSLNTTCTPPKKTQTKETLAYAPFQRELSITACIVQKLSFTPFYKGLMSTVTIETIWNKMHIPHTRFVHTHQEHHVMLDFSEYEGRCMRKTFWWEENILCCCLEPLAPRVMWALR